MTYCRLGEDDSEVEVQLHGGSVCCVDCADLGRTWVTESRTDMLSHLKKHADILEHNVPKSVLISLEKEIAVG